MPVNGSKAEADFLLRAERAALIAPGTPAAKEPLRFAERLFRAQAEMASALLASHAREPLSGVLSGDAKAVIAGGRPLLEAVARDAPAPLAQAARERQGEDAGRFEARLEVYWSGDLLSRDDYLSRAVLRPYCAILSAFSLQPDRPRTAAGCPFCGGAPAVSVRRPDGDTTRRLLCCGLCGGEWPVNRIRCPACGEEDPPRLPTFQTETYPAARIEACDTCMRYVKSIDLSRDGRPIPEVDELASLGLDLWAGEQGYARIEPGLAGL
jgi:formate dehydrogenase accessory protein FdhE